MEKNEFLTEVQNALESDESITMDTELVDIEEWDSMGMLLVVSMVDEQLSKKVTTDELRNCITGEDLAKLVGLA